MSTSRDTCLTGHASLAREANKSGFLIVRRFIDGHLAQRVSEQLGAGRTDLPLLPKRARQIAVTMWNIAVVECPVAPSASPDVFVTRTGGITNGSVSPRF